MSKFVKVAAAVVVALAAVGSAQAAKPTPTDKYVFKNARGQHAVSIRPHPVPAGTVPCLTATGRTSNGEFRSGDANNSVVELNIGAGNSLQGVAVDASVTANDPSWLFEARITFSSSDPKDPNAITYTASETEEPGTEETSTGGVVMFADIPLDDIPVGKDGILRIEWHEDFDDTSVDPDANWAAAAAPAVCQGVRLICSNQSACDVTVPVSLQQFSVD
ncbi:MAG TPA: hypothetical protein VJ724_15975 [Tahibacter sp.]|nr:hypothetical protein [Tahibacter sp.]